MSYPQYEQDGSSQTTLAGSTAEDTASIQVPPSVMRYADPYTDTDGDDELPDVAAYEGPAVPADLVPPSVNPSGSGNTSPAGQGVADVVPSQIPDRGPHSDVQAPDNPAQRGTTGYGR